MKRFVQTLSVFVLVVSSIVGGLVANAHEGKEHDAPKVVSAPKGGIIQPLHEGYVEVVAKGKDLKIYVYDKDVKPYAMTDVKVEAKAILPRTKGPIDLIVSAKSDSFESSFDAKGAHRYTLVLSVKQTSEPKPIDLKYTIEPRK